jgi:hypothetical protein
MFYITRRNGVTHGHAAGHLPFEEVFDVAPDTIAHKALIEHGFTEVPLAVAITEARGRGNRITRILHRPGGGGDQRSVVSMDGKTDEQVANIFGGTLVTPTPTPPAAA